MPRCTRKGSIATVSAHWLLRRDSDRKVLETPTFRAEKTNVLHDQRARQCPRAALLADGTGADRQMASCPVRATEMSPVRAARCRPGSAEVRAKKNQERQ